MPEKMKMTDTSIEKQNTEKTSIAEKKQKVEALDASLKSMEDFSSPEDLYDEMIRRVKSYNPNADIEKIHKAYSIAREAHEGQLRKSGEPYIIHPLCVGIILADLELDEDSIISGLLHDVVEDTVMTKEELTETFGEQVALIVDGVTKLGQLKYSQDKLEEQAENLRKMFLAMSKDIRVILIKLSDRLHNMRTLKYMKPAKQIEKARETMEVYAPIAQRLGIIKLKNELDDLALKFLHPDAYYSLVKQIDQKKAERERFVNHIVDVITQNMKDAEIEAQVSGRAKHFFSIYKKMVNQQKTLDQLYDLFAVRIIVDSVKDCYAALGVIHDLYTPIPGRFKDYIAMPKPNHYQSLHTTLIGPSGTPFEIQIRTLEMHRVAEYGIAAHWRYKAESGGRKASNEESEKLNWLRQILEWQQEASDNQEFLSLLKSDLNLFNDSVYCFSPGGDVKTLPMGSCTIDFAYAVHSAVGNRMVGARVNGRLVPIETELHNGDQVEIVTSQNSRGPSRDWLKVVRSTQAKNKINQWFRKEFKEENIVQGREMLHAYAKGKGENLSDYLQSDYKDVVIRKYGFQDWESVLAAIGHGGLKEGQVLNKLMECYKKDHQSDVTDAEVIRRIAEETKLHPAKGHEKGGITVMGVNDVAVRFSKCCRPIPGDEIIGYITRGRGITIHRTDCINLIHLPPEERERIIDAEWAPQENSSRRYQVGISVYATNRTGLMVDVAGIFSEQKIDISTINCRTDRQGNATLEMSFEVASTGELNNLIKKVQNVPSVIEVVRAQG